MNDSPDGARNALLSTLDILSSNKVGAEAILHQNSLIMILDPVSHNPMTWKVAQKVLAADGIPLHGKALLHLRSAVTNITTNFDNSDARTRIHILKSLEQLLGNLIPVRHFTF